MSRFLAFAALMVLVLTAVSCAALAQARPPAFVVTDPVAVRDETSQAGIARLEVGVWRRTYEVPGEGAEAIAKNLNALRVSAGHEDFAAQTKWDLRWSMRYKQDASSCRLAAVTIEYYAVVTLPSWVSEEALAPADLDRWYTFGDALESHEMAHVQFGIAQAEALRQALLAMDVQPDCRAIAAEISRVGESAKQSIRHADESFDAETKHGALAGATFP